MTQNLPPATSLPSLSSEEHHMRWNRYSRHRRYWLSALAVLFVAVMVIGIVFVAHKYYHDMGGQGFLKTRRVGSPADVCLPLRKTEIRDGHGESISASSAGYSRRSGEDVPFFACGDQQNSCEAFGQPVSQIATFSSKSHTYSGHLLPRKNSLLSYHRRNITFQNILL